MSLIQANGAGLGGAGAPGGALAGGAVFSHTINQGLRFDATGYLTRNTGEAGNTTVYTTSFWVKRSNLTSNQYIFSAGPWNGGDNFEGIRFVNDDTLRAILTVSNSTVANFTTNAVFRDVTAWYHIVWQRNGQAYKLYVNGTEQTYSTSTFSSNPSGYLTADTEQLISGRLDHAQDLDGYLAEFNFVDGQAYDPSFFGETKDGVWVPKEYTGSYGTTGFHLTFSNSSSIGADSSGLSHNFTVSGIDAHDVVPDSPTNNFATWNYVGSSYGGINKPAVSEGALKAATAGNPTHFFSTFAIEPNDTQGYYWEVKAISIDTSRSYIGIVAPEGDAGTASAASYSYNYKFVLSRVGTFFGNNDSNASGTVSLTSWTNNDILMLAYKDGKIWIGKNGTWMNSGDPANGTGDLVAQDGSRPSDRGDVTWYPYAGYNSTYTANFGQDGTFAGTETAQGNSDGNGIGDFYYSVPSGFVALCTSNLPDPTIGPGQDKQADDFFETILYTGNGAEQHIGSGGVQHPQDTATIANSLKFNDADQPGLRVEFSGDGTSQALGTFSWWMKRCKLGASQENIYFEASGYGGIQIRNDKLSVNSFDSSNTQVIVESALELQDVSGWYHCVVSVNGTAGTIKFYINGAEQAQTVTTGSLASGRSWDFLSHDSRRIFDIGDSSGSQAPDAYFAEFIHIDGQALDPTYFGQVGSNGYWIPKTISGLTYGTNGFRLTFQNSSYLGYDYQTSDRSTTNDFTPSNIVATDQVTDSPTQNFAVLDSNYVNDRTQTFAEGNLDYSSTQTSTNPAVVSTFAVNTGKWYWEVYIRAEGNSANSVGIASKPNDLQDDSTAGYSKDWAFSYQKSGTARNNGDTSYGDAWSTGDIIGVALDLDAGTVKFYKNGTVQNSGTAAFTGLSSTEGFTSYSLVYNSGAQVYNFGQDDSFNNNKTSGTAGASDANGVGTFYYTPPSGHLALVDDNIAAAGLPAPDWVWIKNRSTNNVSHVLQDSVRGIGANGVNFNSLITDSNTAEFDQSDADGVSRLDFQGFTVGHTNSLAFNDGSETYVAWMWKAGGLSPTQTYKVHVDSDGGQNKYRFRNSADDATFATYAPTLSLQEGGTYVFDWSHSTAQGHPIRFSTTSDGTHNSGSEYTTGVVKDDSAYKTTITVAHDAPTLYYYCQNHSGMGGQVNTTSTHGSTNFDGSIQSVVSAATDAGFSIVSYTGNSSTATVGHGLSLPPEVVIVRRRNHDSSNWFVFHKFGQTSGAEIGYLNLTNAFAASTSIFNNTVPTNQVFSLGNSNSNVTDDNYIAYCFHSVLGYSKFGSYIGNNNANGTFVYLGFRPAWVLWKREDGTNGWFVLDSVRDVDNVANTFLRPNTDDDEATAANSIADFLSNGFKLRGNGGDVNANSAKYVYLAFAEAPFKFSNAR